MSWQTAWLKPSLTKGLKMFPVEAFQTTLGKATVIFQQLGIRFHLTGGVTSVLYGEPRMTQDIDIVVDNEVLAEQLETFFRRLDTGDFLFDPTSVRRAVARREMFQLLDKAESSPYLSMNCRVCG